MKVWESMVWGFGGLIISVAVFLGCVWAVVKLLRYLEVIG